ncbi:hypothetical protein HAX54_009620 [Datura stramonium]|uniref:Uncharacterized protein n=1 Tax=Datura stramonium TaxID=4076 RepID=A0ABS8THU6_DATST|nr:hypothetical protein [Datura stramonium]
MAVNAAQPISSPSRRSRSSTTTKSSSTQAQSLSSASSTQPPKPSLNPAHQTAATESVTSIRFGSGSEYHLDTSVATTSVSSQASLSRLRSSLPDNPQVYDFSDIRAATNNFLAKRYSSTSSSQSWRCTLHGKDVIIFQRRIQKSMEKSELRAKLSVICRSHYKSIIKLLGASISGDHIYLVYDFVVGSNLSLCLRNPRNLAIRFSLLGCLECKSLDVCSQSGLYTHFTDGGALQCNRAKAVTNGGEICEEASTDSMPDRRGSATRGREFEGVKGYMSPEFQLTGVATQKSDVKISVIATAREVVECGGDGEEDDGLGAERRLGVGGPG